LQVIDALKEQFGRFPTYSELAKRFGTTRQDISSCLGRIKSCYEMIQKEPSFEEIDAFSAAAVSIANGWVALRVHLENGEIASQKVTFRKKADAMLNGEVQK
jgi:DNA-directed RNA polymerase specialized sigma subunit